MNELKHNEFGRIGEEIAHRQLLSKGYFIRERNFTFGKLEIDIIAEKDEILVFVEVKTRNSNYFGEPYEAVSRQKQKQIIKAANAYIDQFECDLEARFDVFSLILSEKNQKVEHIVDAFRP